jgi:hypothetical protein
MKMRIVLGVVAAILCGALYLGAAVPGWETVPRISQEEAAGMIGKPDVVFLDVRQQGDWDQSERKIKGAVRVDPKTKIGDIMDKYPQDAKLVFY